MPRRLPSSPHVSENVAPESCFVGLSYPESPRWRDGLLWLSDVHNFRMKAFDERGALSIEIDVPGRPAGLGFMPDGSLLVATALGRDLRRLEGDHLVPVADLSHHTTGLLNDMVVDRAGRAYVGDTGFDLGANEPHRPGRLLLFDDAGGARIAAEDVNFPNGMAITPDGATLLLAETFANRITAFDIQSDGSLTGRRVHAALAGTPDGVCLDAEGGLWIGLLASGVFIRIDRNELFLCHSVVDASNSAAVRREGMVTIHPAPFAGVGIP